MKTPATSTPPTNSPHLNSARPDSECADSECADSERPDSEWADFERAPSEVVAPAHEALKEPVWLLLLIGWLFATTSLDWHSRNQLELPAEPSTPMNLRESSGRELRQLPGIGPARAADIVDLRWQRGGQRFDLQEVSGIGPKTDARVRAALQQQPTFDELESESPAWP